MSEENTNLTAKAIQTLMSCDIPEVVFTNHKIDLENPVEGGRTLLFYACELGRKKVAEHLMDLRVNKHHKDENLKSVLHVAAERGHVDIVQLLITRGLSVDSMDKFNNTPLTAAVMGSHVKVVDLLIANGADVNVGRKDGWSPLYHAVLSRSFAMAERLLKAGAHITHTVQSKLQGQGGEMVAMLQYFNAKPTWLRTHLADANVSYTQIVWCEDKLVKQEGFTTEALFASVTAEQFNAAFLASLGITGMGLHQLLLGLHRRLHQEHHGHGGAPAAAEDADAEAEDAATLGKRKLT